MKKLMVALVVACLALPLSGFAQHGMGHGGKGNWAGKQHKGKQGDQIGRLLRAADEIGLSEDQVAKLKTMRMEFKMAAIEQHAEIEKAGVQLKFLIANSESQESDVHAAIERVAGLKAEMHKMNFSAHRSVRSLLTENQREKIEEHQKKMRSERKEKRKKPNFRGNKGRRGGSH